MPNQPCFSVACPHTKCRNPFTIYEELGSNTDEKMMIICHECGTKFGVNLKTRRVIKRINEIELELPFYISCPECRKHRIYYETKADIIVGDVCSNCGCYFRVNFSHGSAWKAKPIKKK